MKTLILVAFACLILTFSITAQTSSDNSLNNDTTATKEAKPKRVIFRASKEQVMQVQTMLKEKSKYAGEVDGKFNKDFRTAIKDFQGENELKKTGTLNRATLEKMGVQLTEKQMEMPVNPNSFAGDDDDDDDKERKPSIRPTKAQITELRQNSKPPEHIRGMQMADTTMIFVLL